MEFPSRTKFINLIKLVIWFFIVSIPTVSYYSKYNLITLFLGCTGFAFTIIYMLLENKINLTIPREIILLSIWILIAVISSAFAADFRSSIEKISTMVQIVLMCVVIINISLWTKDYKFVLSALVASSIINIGFEILHFGGFPEDRWSGLTLNSNTFGMLMITGSFSAIILFLLKIQARGRVKIYDFFYIGLISIFIMGAVFSESKKAVFAAFTCIALVPYSIFRLINNRIISWIMILVVMPIAIFLFGDVIIKSAAFERIETSINYFDQQRYRKNVVNDSTGLRVAYILAGIEMFKANPLVGVGIGNFADNVKKYSPKYGVQTTYSHCNYIEILSSTGILGFIAYFSIYISILERFIKLAYNLETERSWLLPISICFVVFMILDIGYVSYYDKIYWIWNSFTIAICIHGKKLSHVLPDNSVVVLNRSAR